MNARCVTVKLIEARLGMSALRAFGRVYPWTWLAYDERDHLLATGRDRATREEILADIASLFGTRTDVVLVDAERAGFPEPWPLRRAVTA